MNKPRNCIIELYRFFASLFIAMFHFEWMYIGHTIYLPFFYIFVEFFYILSGFFLAANLQSQKKENEDAASSIHQTIKQFKKMYPQYLIAFIFSFITLFIINAWPLKQVLPVLFQTKWELLLLQLGGFDQNIIVINGVTAYISGLLVATLILHYLLENHFKIFINLIAPILLIFTYSHLIQVYGDVSQWFAYENWFCIGILRALGGMSLGALTYVVGYKKINTVSNTKLVLINIFCIIGISSLIFLRNYIAHKDLLIYLPIFSLLILSAYSMTNIINVNIIRWICMYLGKLSYSIFLIHYAICELLHHYLPDFAYLYMLVFYLSIVLILGIFLERFNFKLSKHNHIWRYEAK
jgi:peptidoglycan/LPS O-acetylase OafA/YrhL